MRARALHRAPHLGAVTKPSGLLVHRGWDNDRDVLMTRIRDAIGSKVYPLHRLDRGASGVVLFALSSQSASAMGALFQARAIDKHYLALVRGASPVAAVIDQPIPRTEGVDRVASVTEIARILQLGRYALVLARPLSGRLHQIRRHLKHVSCPLIGDVRYGKGEHNRLFRERYGLHRLALHALSIAFTHPVTGERLCLRAPVPADLREPLERWAGEHGSADPLAAVEAALDACP